MKQKVYIRADGNSQIGLGHVIRCCALADMLRDDFSCTFLIQNPTDFLITEIKNAGAVYIEILETQNYISEVKEIVEKIINNNDIVVLDGYNFNTEYQQIIKNTGCKLVCIDDMHQYHFVADAVINHAPYVVPSDYNSQPFTKYALGCEYALLRPAFLEQATIKRKIEKVENVLICFGGSDFKNLTKKTLEIVLNNSIFQKIFVVTGSAYIYNESIKKLIKSDNRILHFSAINDKKMIELMVKSDLAIIPASGILYEAICLEIIILTCWYADNQKEFHDYFISNFGLNSFGDNSILFNSDLFLQQLSILINDDNNISHLIKNKIINSKSNILQLFKEL